MSRKVSIGILRKLKAMSEGETVSAGSNKNEEFLNEMVTSGALKKHHQKSRVKFYCDSPEDIYAYLRIQYGIFDLVQEIANWQQKNLSRSQVLSANANEKSGSTKPFKGFLIASLVDMEVEIAKKTVHLPAPQGSSLFIHNWETFHIPKKCRVVIVENFENFTALNKQAEHFNTVPSLFIFRFYDRHQSLINWLQAIDNQVLYFGDWDFGGIKIFVTEFERKLPNRCQFFIPKQLPEWFVDQNKGNRARYQKQLNMISEKHFEHLPKMVQLAKLFHQHYKVLAQEALIK